MQSKATKRSDFLALPHLDRRAFVMASLGAGLAALLASLLLSGIVLGDPEFLVRVAASLVLGPEVIPATSEGSAAIILVGLLVLLALALVYGLLIVLVVHRWGLVVGLIGGALIGAALYVIDIYAVSYFFPWIYPMRNWMLLLTHMVLGGTVGVIYELLDKYDLPFPATQA